MGAARGARGRNDERLVKDGAFVKIKGHPERREWDTRARELLAFSCKLASVTTKRNATTSSGAS